MAPEECLPPPRERRGGGRRSLIVAVDGSDVSMRAAEYALGCARRQGMDLVGAYVRHASALACWTPHGADFVREAHDVRAAEVRAYLAERAGELGVAHDFRVLSGSPVGTLRRLAGELRAEALVVGAGRHPRRHIGLTVPARLTRAARCPVIVVP